MLVLGIPKRTHCIVLRHRGSNKTIARIIHQKCEQGRIKRVVIDAELDIVITRERIVK